MMAPKKPKKPAPKPKPKKKPVPKKKSGADLQREWEAYASKYGMPLAVFRSVPELWNLLVKATNEGWDAKAFGVALQNTRWYKTHSDSYRQMFNLEKSDPAGFKRLQSEMLAKVQDMAGQMGIKPNATLFNNITRGALYGGWSDAQIKNALADQLDFASGSHFGGEAGASEDMLRQYAWAMGVRFSDDTLKQWLTSIAKGDSTVQDYKAYLQTLAESAFPALAERLKGGMSVQEIADPYIQSMAQILELNPKDINLFDPDIRRALSGTNADGQPQGMTIWEWENQLRKDPRWLSTNNAREGINSTARQVLQQWGFAW